MKRKIVFLFLIITLSLAFGCSDKNAWLEEENKAQNQEIASSESTSIQNTGNSNKDGQTPNLLLLSEAEKDIYNK